MARKNNDSGDNTTIDPNARFNEYKGRRGASYMPKDKLGLRVDERQMRYGKHSQPIPADGVYWAPIDRFSAKDRLAEKWILINSDEGTMTFVNTYDGATGVNYDMVAQTQPLDAKRLQTKLRDGNYIQVSVDDCPVCVSLEQAKDGKIKSAEQVTNESVGDRGSARVSSHELEGSSK